MPTNPKIILLVLFVVITLYQQQPIDSSYKISFLHFQHIRQAKNLQPKSQVSTQPWLHKPPFLSCNKNKVWRPTHQCSDLWRQWGEMKKEKRSWSKKIKCLFLAISMLCVMPTFFLRMAKIYKITSWVLSWFFLLKSFLCVSVVYWHVKNLAVKFGSIVTIVLLRFNLNAHYFNILHTIKCKL